MDTNRRLYLAEETVKVLARIAAASLVLAVVGAAVTPALPSRPPTRADTQGTSGSVCIDAIGGVACSAEDVDIGTYTVLAGPTSCVAGTPIEVTLGILIENHANQRYDFGMYVAEDGGDARTGTCFRDFLNPVSADNTDLDLTGGLGPYFNGEITDPQVDFCGDVEQGTQEEPAQVIYNLPPIDTICRDSDGDGYADLGTCVAWYHNSSHTCTNELDATAGTGSKCKCEAVRVGEIEVPAYLEVVKVLDPTDDPGVSNLRIDGIDGAMNVGNGGSTGVHAVAAGNHNVSETAGTNTDLSNYEISIVCKNMITSEVVASCTSCTALDVPVAEQIQCTVTNVQGPTAVSLTSLNAVSRGTLPLVAGAVVALLGVAFLVVAARFGLLS